MLSSTFPSGDIATLPFAHLPNVAPNTEIRAPDLSTLDNPIRAERSMAPVADAKSLPPIFAQAFPASLAGSPTRAEAVASGTRIRIGRGSVVEILSPGLWWRVFQVESALSRPSYLTGGSFTTDVHVEVVYRRREGLLLNTFIAALEAFEIVVFRPVVVVAVLGEVVLRQVPNRLVLV